MPTYSVNIVKSQEIIYIYIIYIYIYMYTHTAVYKNLSP